MPSDGVGEQQMCKELADILQLIRVQSMGRVVYVLEIFFTLLHVDLVGHTEPMGEQTVKFLISTLSGTTPENHTYKFMLLSRLDLHFQFVSTF
jgi:hypothetical protein